MGVVKALLTGNISAYIASSIILAHTLWGAIKAIPPFINEPSGVTNNGRT